MDGSLAQISADTSNMLSVRSGRRLWGVVLSTKAEDKSNQRGIRGAGSEERVIDPLGLVARRKEDRGTSHEGSCTRVMIERESRQGGHTLVRPTRAKRWRKKLAKEIRRVTLWRVVSSTGAERRDKSEDGQRSTGDRSRWDVWPEVREDRGEEVMEGRVTGLSSSKNESRHGGHTLSGRRQPRGCRKKLAKRFESDVVERQPRGSGRSLQRDSRSDVVMLREKRNERRGTEDEAGEKRETRGTKDKPGGEK